MIQIVIVNIVIVTLVVIVMLWNRNVKGNLQDASTGSSRFYKKDKSASESSGSIPNGSSKPLTAGVPTRPSRSLTAGVGISGSPVDDAMLPEDSLPASEKQLRIWQEQEDLGSILDYRDPRFTLIKEDGAMLSEEETVIFLNEANRVLNYYTEELKYANPDIRVTVWIAPEGGIAGGGEQDNPDFAIPANIIRDILANEPRGDIAHELMHTLQAATGGMTESEYSKWFWESHAEFMRVLYLTKHNTNYVGCASALVNSPQLYYGTTRNRYCNWQFWAFLMHSKGITLVNRIWTDGVRPEGECIAMESPFSALIRLGHSVFALNSMFGQWAMSNVTWDGYGNLGDVLKSEWNLAEDALLRPGERGRLTRLVALGNHVYRSPNRLAPQRWGYNVVRLYPTQQSGNMTIAFRGVCQESSNVTSTQWTARQTYEHEPEVLLPPDSGWRWGVVSVGSGVRKSALQITAQGELTWPFHKGERHFLIVLGAPSSLHDIQWDQKFYTVYRYPYCVQLQGVLPDGQQPLAPLPDDYARHANGGGRVENTARVDDTVVVEWNATVMGNSIVTGRAKIRERAIVDNATVEGNAEIRDHAYIQDATISDSAIVEESAQISGNRVKVGKNAKIGAISWIAGETVVSGDARIYTTNAERAISNGIFKGTVQLIGDVEYNGGHRVVDKGVFYGTLWDEWLDSAEHGAELLQPLPEVTLDEDSITWSQAEKICSSVERITWLDECFQT